MLWNHLKNQYLRRTQKNYSLSLKLAVVREVESGSIGNRTYIGGRDRNCYLALVTDAYSKKIMGYDLSNSLATDGSLRALNGNKTKEIQQ